MTDVEKKILKALEDDKDLAVDKKPTGMGKAMAIAAVKSNVENASAPQVLPDLPDEAPSLSSEELEEAAQKAQETKSWAEKAGERLLDLKKEQRRIHAVEGWDLVRKLAERDALLSERIKEIEEAGDENLSRHVEYSEFLNFIREVETPEQIKKVLRRLLDESVNEDGVTRVRDIHKEEAHRLKSANKGRLPRGYFYVEGQCYAFYSPSEGQEKSSGQKALEAEFTKALRRVSLQKKRKIRKKTEELRALTDVSDDLDGMIDKDDPQEGLYRIFKEPVKEGKRVIRHGGVGIVRLVLKERGDRSFAIIEAVDGTGCFHFLSGQEGKLWASVPNAIFGKVPENLPSDVCENVLRFTRALNKHLFPIWKAQKESKEE
ncbi:MAG: hypothetical protein BMS9Abin13_119 [Patescibacteria group bacterium]|nr:MAG: hypothetical protein BMS9Abin13_119 [Patescibacteria group bacterium]